MTGPDIHREELDTLDPVGPEAAAQLRIVTFINVRALSVPIGAVQSYGGAHRLQVVDPATGEPEERLVEIGPATWDSVEIRAGLKAGETILVPEG